MARRVWGAPLLAAAVLAVAGGDAALAQGGGGGPVTAGALGELCASADPSSAAFCRGFLIATGQYHVSVTAAPGGRPPVFCLDAAGPAPTVEQAQSAYAAWARANPQHAGERAVDGVSRWAAEAFPCPAAAAPTARGARR